METTPRSADNIGLASALTALNVVVASGFSIAGLIKPELVLPTGATPTDASAIFAMYAAARTIPLALITMVAIYKGSASALLVLGVLAGIIQFADAAVGLFQHDVGQPVGPLFLAILQGYAVTIFLEGIERNFTLTHSARRRYGTWPYRQTLEPGRSLSKRGRMHNVHFILVFFGSNQRISARRMSLKVDERLRTMRAVTAPRNFSFWAGSPAFG